MPGETKVWQYITLMKRIFLIDCPGVVYNKAERHRHRRSRCSRASCASRTWCARGVMVNRGSALQV